MRFVYFGESVSVVWNDLALDHISNKIKKKVRFQTVRLKCSANGFVTQRHLEFHEIFTLARKVKGAFSIGMLFECIFLCSLSCRHFHRSHAAFQVCPRSPLILCLWPNTQKSSISEWPNVFFTCCFSDVKIRAWQTVV